MDLAEGVAEIEIVPRAGDKSDDAGDDAEPQTIVFSQHLARPSDGKSFEELAPRNFSFNSPYGACEHCDGLGMVFEVDPELVVPDTDLSLADGAIAPWASGHSQYFHRLLEAVAKDLGVDVDTPFRSLPTAGSTWPSCASMRRTCHPCRVSFLRCHWGMPTTCAKGNSSWPSAIPMHSRATARPAPASE